MLPQFDNTEIAFKYRTTKDLKQAQFLFSSMGSPVLTKIGMAATKVLMGLHLPIKGLIKNTIFRQFCGGETMEEAANTAAMLSKYNVDTILDYGVEGKEDEHDFDNAVTGFITAIQYAATQKSIPFISIKITGLARFALLEKIHVGTQLTDQEAAEWQRVFVRTDKVCKAGYDNNIKILIDAEESWVQKPVDDLCDAMMAAYNKKDVVVYNTFQLYRHDRLVFLKQSLDTATEKGYLLGAKLVRGAYMEKERARALANGYPSPIQADKANTDKDYDEALLFCLQHLDQLGVFIGTHNEKSCLLAAQYMQEHTIPATTDRVHFSQLYGMSDNMSFNLADSGYRVAKYLPYGPVEDVIPYLMRRAQENTSVAGQTGRELSLIKKELDRRKAS